jgi:signal transduction histidine kinase
LIAAVESCVDHWRRRLPNTEITLSASGDFGAISEQGSLTVYRIVQEALTNIAKHSAATRVTLELNTAHSAPGLEFKLKIADDGAGIDLARSASGFGLINMRERVEMQGGKLQIESSPNRGFMLCASFTE